MLTLSIFSFFVIGSASNGDYEWISSNGIECLLYNRTKLDDNELDKRVVAVRNETNKKKLNKTNFYLDLVLFSENEIQIKYR